MPWKGSIMTNQIGTLFLWFTLHIPWNPTQLAKTKHKDLKAHEKTWL